MATVKKAKCEKLVAVLLFRKAEGDDWATVVSDGQNVRVYTNGSTDRAKSLREGANMCLKMGFSVYCASTETYCLTNPKSRKGNDNDV